MSTFLVSVGLHGSVGRFRPVDHTPYPRDCQVICRTNRGLEVGTVMTRGKDSPVMGESAAATVQYDGEVLRKVTPDDEMIIQRIERFRDRAFLACESLIQQRKIPAVLVDVEHLFDGQNLYFYFLGEPSNELDELTDELAEAYEAKVRFRKFTETLASGCGPDCGTGVGCSSSGCASCSINSACKNS